MGFSFNEIMQDLELEERVKGSKEITNCLKRSGFLLLTEPAESEICRSLHQTVARLKELGRGSLYFGSLLERHALPHGSGKRQIL